MEAATRIILRVVMRAKDPIILVQKGHPFFLIPTVVSTRQDLSPGIKDLSGDGPRESTTTSSILGIGNHEIRLPLINEKGKEMAQYLTARRPHDIRKEEDSHSSPAPLLRAEKRRRVVESSWTEKFPTLGRVRE
jgi:hypothetical protein